MEANEENLNVHVIELSSYEAPEIVEDRREDWVLFGEDHYYYDWLLERYHKSSTNNSVINNVARLAYGRGIHALDASRKPNEYAQMKALFSDKTIRKGIKELKMLGQTAIQTVWNKQHTKVIRAEYLPVKELAPNKLNKDGNIVKYWHSSDWSDTKKFIPKPFPVFGSSKETVEILVIQPFTVGMKYYSMPDYEGALPYAVLEEEIADFLINDVQGAFSGTKVINFNNGIPSKEEQKVQKNKVMKKLTGAKGDKVIVAFNANAEQKTTIDDIALDDAPEHYAYLSKESQSKILAGHSVVSPFLVGVHTENQGFSSNADEIEVSAIYMHNISIKPIQDLYIDGMDEILAMNSVSLDLYFERLNVLDTVEKQQQAKENAQLNSHLQGLLAGFGETIDPKEWTLIDERDVDYDQEEDLNLQVQQWTTELSKPKTLLQKLQARLAGTGTARPNANSSQDQKVNDFYFKVRYEYTGDESPERDFCKAMMSANKLYRKEDIVQMNSELVNAGHGHDGQDYDIFKYKGGVNCEHRWTRKTFVSASRSIDTKSPNATTVSTGKAQRFGYRVDNPTEVSMKPKDMPNNGHHPNF